jgi:hypothetical protein
MLIAWEEFSAAMQLKHRFLCLMRQYEGQGILATASLKASGFDCVHLLVHRPGVHPGD